MRAELIAAHPGVTVALAELDVTDHGRVPVVFAELATAIGGLDRVIAR